MIDHRRIFDRSHPEANTGVDVGPGTKWFDAASAREIKSNPAQGRVAYEQYLRKLDDVPGIERLKDRHLVTTALGMQLAGILFRVAGLRSQELYNEWLHDGISAFDVASHVEEQKRQWEADYAANPINTAKDALRAFLAEREVFYTNEEFNTLFDTMYGAIARGSAPFA